MLTKCVPLAGLSPCLTPAETCAVVAPDPTAIERLAGLIAQHEEALQDHCAAWLRHKITADLQEEEGDDSTTLLQLRKNERAARKRAKDVRRELRGLLNSLLPRTEEPNADF